MNSAGSIIKKIVEINPRLSVQEVTAIIRSAMEKDQINEAKAIALAKASVQIIAPQPR